MVEDESQAAEEASAMDPIVSAAGGVAKATGLTKTLANLLERLFGPLADVYGEEWARRASERFQRNAVRVLEIAATKPGADADGEIPLRVAAQLLEQSGLADDELMAEYLAGMLASSRTPDGRDDRAVAWSTMLAGMSSLQIRAHFLLYRAWSAGLANHAGLNLWASDAHASKALMFVEQEDFVRSLGMTDANVLSHVLPGLERLGLIEGPAWGQDDALNYKGSPYKWVIAVAPTAVGMELFGWAAGSSDIGPANFAGFEAEWSDGLPRLSKFSLPRLP